ncbi:2,3-diaminopropionate biosynthesis protein SbnA [Streptomyces odontomachi]|uniref:2,3-diaminopropionate biosynthesis protein SbnA n=1 Tax=Streptomyces odontomachi TaxID=2944940 RepID=UPI002109AD65|nr:2,3-diaminopropionate biosynthesis protein SbnA [Streptomyces sp. ODS25]
MIPSRVYDVPSGDRFLELPGFQDAFSTTVKLEGLNPAGSIKIKAAREMVLDAESRGVLTPGCEIIESTSGNLGVALASICAAKGYRLTLVTDPNANARTVRFCRALGARVVTMRRHDAAGGYLGTRIEFIRRRVAAEPGLVWLNQYSNPQNPRAHSRHTVTEILDAFGVPDWLFVGTGTSGTLMGCVRGLRERGLPTRVVAVDAVGSVTFGGPPARRCIPGIGASRRPELLDDDGTFLKTLVAEPDSVRMCRRVARVYGLLLGGSSGSALAAVAALRERIAPGSRVLVLSPDMGDGYLDTVYDDDWVRERFGQEGLDAVAGPPVEDILRELGREHV